jgi:hypothetical protein
MLPVRVEFQAEGCSCCVLSVGVSAVNIDLINETTRFVEQLKVLLGLPQSTHANTLQSTSLLQGER